MDNIFICLIILSGIICITVIALSIIASFELKRYVKKLDSQNVKKESSMEINILICIVIMIIVACSTIIISALVAKSAINYLSERQSMEVYKTYKDIDVEKIDKIFSDIIERSFNDYQKFHPDLSQEGSYIKREEIQSMVTEISTTAYENMTPAIKYNIGLIYDISTDDKLVNLIGEKVGVLVMGFAAIINSTLIDDTQVTTVDIEV